MLPLRWDHRGGTTDAAQDTWRKGHFDQSVKGWAEFCRQSRGNSICQSAKALSSRVCFWNPEDFGVIRTECRLGVAEDEAKGLELD